MSTDEIRYALSKQLASAGWLECNYGRIDLDDEMRDAIDHALRPILERRLAECDD